MKKSTTINFYKLEKTAFINASVLANTVKASKSQSNNTDHYFKSYKMAAYKKLSTEDMPM